ncbi:hypothetical protein QJS04_geneDACA021567 [Acorus gramineus]|uniref:DUF2470 domain-containing protein n=1 Tax=Acorus gramineus TaxID=55184 RepID=A0AAV9B2T9_ACOGR|nr:hypothetical protein QJS04_geneDACA021567 [Acorus gramineus]
MKNPNKSMVLTLPEKCKNILTSNWQARLNTVSADAKGSKNEVYSSKVKYLFRKGRPYIWVRKDDKHNVNTIIDGRASIAVSSTCPGAVGSLLRSINKLPARVALTGELWPLKDEKLKSIGETLRDTILSEREIVSQASYSLSSILNSSRISSISRSGNLQDILNGMDNYVPYKFKIGSCIFVDGNGGTSELKFEDVVASKTDALSPYAEKLVDGINQSEARRRALMLFCFVHFDKIARDALMLSVNRMGFNVFAKVPSVVATEGSDQYQWKDFRFSFREEASDAEAFCHQLVEMEEQVLEEVRSFSGVG